MCVNWLKLKCPINDAIVSGISLFGIIACYLSIYVSTYIYIYIYIYSIYIIYISIHARKHIHTHICCCFLSKQYKYPLSTHFCRYPYELPH